MEDKRMCGIVGYVGRRLAVPLVLEGLHRLEYRGYDSAGFAVPEMGQIRVIKCADRTNNDSITVIGNLAAGLEISATTGLGHTRWATHGARTDRNAHPHIDCTGRLAVVHNGQITNHDALRRQLYDAGHRFLSTTDTEVVPHLIEMFHDQGDDIVTAVRKTCKLLEGSFAIAVVSADEPNMLIGARLGSSLCVGLAADGYFLASDAEAFRSSTTRFVDVEDGQMAIIAPENYRVVTFDDAEVTLQVQEVQFALEAIERGSFTTFMAKEIHEQPEVITRVTEGRITVDGRIKLGGFERRPDLTRFVRDQMSEVLILGCGTSLYAGMMIERQLQELGLRARTCDAAEFTTGPRTLTNGTLVVPISQSGETRDLLDAMEVVRANACWSFALCNKPGTALTKFGSGMYLQAGPEKGVASTKAFTAQVMAGTLLSLHLAALRGSVNTLQISGFAAALPKVRQAAESMLELTQMYWDLGSSLRDVPRMLYIGRGYNLPLAMEGALKMMEITQIPSLGMSAAAMKHGPISLVDSSTVILAVCLPDPLHPDILERSLENVNQVVSAAGRVIVLTTASAAERFTAIDHGEHRVERVLVVPDLLHGTTTATAVIPLQLLALGAAQARGLNVDKPRNLAKAVAVT